MAATAYYNANSMEYDQQRLLSPGMPSPGYSSGQPSPIKPLHLVDASGATHYQHAPSFDDFDNVKVASKEDAVRKVSPHLSCSNARTSSI